MEEVKFTCTACGGGNIDIGSGGSDSGRPFFMWFSCRDCGLRMNHKVYLDDLMRGKVTGFNDSGVKE